MFRPLAVVVALSVLSSAPSVLAQQEWLPCSVTSLKGISVGSTSPRGTSTDETEQPHVKYFEAGLTWSAADFDSFEGTDMPTLQVNAYTLGITARVSEWTTLWLTAPYLDVHDDSPSGDDAAGFGDASAGWARSIPVGNDAWWVSFLAEVTLPTGDEDDHLGMGEPALRAGVFGSFGKDDATFDYPWLKPTWRVTFGAAYRHEWLDGDLDALQAVFAVDKGWERLLFRFGIEASWELADRVVVGSMSRDEIAQADVVVAAVFPFKQGDYELTLGARVALDDHGLRDDVIPSFSFGRRWPIGK